MRIHGQIKVTRLTQNATNRLNAFMSIRRCRYDVKALAKQMTLTTAENTLIGSFGENGEYLIPPVSLYGGIMDKVPGADQNVRNQASQLFEAQAKEILYPKGDEQDYGVTAGACPHLHFGLRFCTPKDDQYSYLVWNGDQECGIFEDVNLFVDTLNYLSSIMRRFGWVYFVSGCMAVYGTDEGGAVKAVVASKGRITSCLVLEDQLTEELAPTVYRPELDPKRNRYAACLRREVSRNVEIFDEDRIPTEQDEENDDLWHLDENAQVFIGIIEAYDEQQARETAAIQYDTNPELIEICGQVD